jgi:hypothetical protein
MSKILREDLVHHFRTFLVEEWKSSALDNSNKQADSLSSVTRPSPDRHRQSCTNSHNAQ